MTKHDLTGIPTYVREIDGLRAIAVLSVVFFHLHPAWIPGGFTGVDIFLVISGYVVSKSLAVHPPSGVLPFLVDFYAKRVVRILPALIVMLLLVGLATVWVVPTSWLSGATEKTGLWAYFGLSNFALILFDDGYFSPRAEFNPFVHTWSLAVEEQFYLVFPLIFFVWLRWRNARTMAKWIFPLLMLASFAVAFFWDGRSRDWAYYLLPARFWELAAGSLLYQWHAGKRSGPSFLSPGVLMPLGVVLLIAGFCLADPARFPYPWAIVPVLGVLCLLHAVTLPDASGKHPIRLMLLHPAVGYIGKTSYSLYLWHWPVYSLMRWTVGLHTPLLMLLAVGLTCALAFLSYHVIENPVRRLGGFRKRPSWPTVAGGVLASVLGFLVASNLYAHRAQLSWSVTADTPVWYPYPVPVPDREPAVQSLQGRNLFVIGNSHAGAYHKMLSEAEQRLGLSVHLFQTGACPMGQLLHPIGQDQACEQTIDTLLQTIEEKGKSGDVVFFASLRTHRLGDQWERFDREQVLAYSQSAEAQKLRLQALQENTVLVERLEKMGIGVLFDAPKPVFPAPIYRCSDVFNRSNPVCLDGVSADRAELLTMREPVMQSLRLLQQRFDRVWLWDPFPILCPEGQQECLPFDADGVPIFFDGDHLSGHGNDVLYPDFSNAMLDIFHGDNASDHWMSMKAIRLGSEIDFRNPLWPNFVRSVQGMSTSESWGRWSDANLANPVRLEFTAPLPDRFSLHLTVGAFTGNDQPQTVDVVIGPVTKTVVLPGAVGDRVVPIELQGDSVNAIEFLVRHPSSPQEWGESDDARKLGIAFVKMALRE